MEIYENHCNCYRRAALEKWKQHNGPGATYGKLIAAFEQASHKDFARAVQKVAGKYNYGELHMQYHCFNLRLVALMCLFFCLILGIVPITTNKPIAAVGVQPPQGGDVATAPAKGELK